MKILLSWLKEFVDVQAPADEVARLLTMSGSEVAAVERVGSRWSKVRIGQVVELTSHPHADRLFIARMDLGSERVSLVTAATNLVAGMKAPVVLPGGALQPGSEIQAVAFQGVRSEGMLCSGLELGISPDGDGIYVMEDQAPVGAELSGYLEDVLIDLDITPNRPDCLSVVGIAREVAALTGSTLMVPPTAVPPASFRSAGEITVEIKDPDLCPRYSAAVLKGVKVRPSPLWMQRRLYLCGVRPISNIVDATNYVMLERGQPLHAFDGDKLEGGIIVRRARDGEGIVTIDGDLRRLSEETLVIADHERAVAIAGVMGGIDTEVTDATGTVVLESANFDRTSIRRTSQRLRLATEASKRFDKGLDPEMTVPSALRAAQLMVETGGGSIGEGVVDEYPGPMSPSSILLSEDDVERILGLRFSRADMNRVFRSLGFGTAEAGDRTEVSVPTFRRDVEGRADLAEEVARITGYDAIPTTLPTGAIPEALPEPYRIWERVAREELVAAGFQEVITYSLVDCDSAARLTVDVGAGAAAIPLEMIRLMNSMTPDQACLRTSLLGSLLRTVASNMRHEQRAYLFELGRVYLPPLAPLPAERRTLGMVLTGHRQPLSWGGQPDYGDFFDMKGAIEGLLGRLGIEGATFRPSTHVTMHPGRTARLVVGEREIGYLGEVHPVVVERYDLEPHRIIAAELDFDALIDLASSLRAYEPLPRYPAVTHDIAVVVARETPHAEVEQEIRRTGEPLLSELQLFDLYEGASIPSGKKSLAYSLSYRLPDRTLTDAEVLEVEERIVRALSDRFGAQIRGR